MTVKPKSCGFCGTPFTPTRRHRKYCSDKCFVKGKAVYNHYWQAEQYKNEAYRVRQRERVKDLYYRNKAVKQIQGGV